MGRRCRVLAPAATALPRFTTGRRYEAVLACGFLRHYVRVAQTSPCSQRIGFPHCRQHIHYVMRRPSISPCHGHLGRKYCEGFQLDRHDACNVCSSIICRPVPHVMLSHASIFVAGAILSVLRTDIPRYMEKELVTHIAFAQFSCLVIIALAPRKLLLHAIHNACVVCQVSIA